LRRQYAALRIQGGLRNVQTRSRLIDSETIRHRVDLEKQITCRNMAILDDRDIRYAPPHLGRDVDNIGVYTGIIGGWHIGTTMMYIECKDNCRHNNRDGS